MGREKLNSQRKRIEALGIRDFQPTVAADVSENHLHWRGIDATLRLATSPHSNQDVQWPMIPWI